MKVKNKVLNFNKDDYKRFKICLKKMYFFKEKESHQEIINLIDTGVINLLDPSWIKDFQNTGINIKDIFHKVESKEFYGETIEDGIKFENACQKYFLNKDEYNCKEFKEYSNKIVIKATKKYIKDERFNVFFQPEFQYKNFITRSDILIKNNDNTFDLIEVKSSTAFKKDLKNNKYKQKSLKNEYYQDILYQYFILINNGIDIRNVGFAFIDNTIFKNSFNQPDEDFVQIFYDFPYYKKIINLKEYCEENIIKVKEELEFMVSQYEKFNIQNLSENTCLNSILEDNNPYCKHIIKGKQYNDHIFNLYKGLNKTLGLYYKYQIKSIKDIDLENNYIFQSKTLKFNKENISQIQYYKTKSKINSNYFDYLLSLLDKYKLPLVMYDFETMKSSIPIFMHSYSYQQIPFQYSMHFIDNYNNDNSYEKKHKFFIADPSCDPRIKFIKNFCNDIEPYLNGIFVAYNKSFERKVILECIEFLKKIEITNYNKEKYISILYKIYDKTIDLMDFFKDFAIYNDEFKGKKSIKFTLPALEPNFTYKHLKVQKGDMASELFRRVVEKNIKLDDWNNYIKEHMINYCNLDTWAMVKIFESIIILINNYIKHENLNKEIKWRNIN